MDWIVTALFIIIGVPAAIGYGLMASHMIITAARARQMAEERERFRGDDR